MRQFRKVSLIRFLSFSLAIYLLNISIDPRDGSEAWAKEDLAVNEIESVLELLVEEILDFEDVIPEHEDADGEKNAQVSFFKSFSPSVFIFSLTKFIDKLKILQPRFVSSLVEQSEDVIAPPPKKQL